MAPPTEEWPARCPRGRRGAPSHPATRIPLLALAVSLLLAASLARAGDPAPAATTPDEFLDLGAAAFRKWWETSKDRLRYDREKGAWVVGP